MNSYKLIETKLWNAITALTSGVLTSLIYDAISSTSYVLQNNGEQYTLIQNKIDFFKTIGFIIITFIIIWFIISIIIPIGLKLKKRFSYRRINQSCDRDLVKTFNAAKEITLALHPIFIGESGAVSNSDFAKLRVKDLAEVITSLHQKFNPHNRNMKRHIPTYFRKSEYSSIYNIGDGISNYEFSSLVTMLKKMVINISDFGSNDILLQKDCGEMLSNLKDLEEIAAAVSHDI